MLENEFIARDILIHRLDPRVKIISVFSFSVVVALLNNWHSLVFAFLLGLYALYLSGLPAKELIRRFGPINMFLLFLWLVLPFSVTGKALFHAGPMTATREGVFYALRITVKSNAIMTLLVALVSSTSVLDLGNALSELKIPGKIVQLLFFTYRYIHVLYMEYIRIMNALKVRVFQPRTNFHTYQTYAYLVGMLLVRSSSRGERVYNAMLCRGFKGNFYSLSSFSMKTRDWFFLLLMFILIVFLVLLKWTTAIP